MKERIAWIDIAKCIGIFTIYLGHFHGAAGYAYPFVFTFHVPLFFFLSGCSERISADASFKNRLFNNAKRLLFPFYFFSLAALALHCIVENSSSDLLESIFCIVKGNVRNTYFAEALWFLSCLFVMKTAFSVIRKLFKRKIFIFLVCLALFVLADKIFPPSPIVQPRLPYNIDSAAYYIVFYAIGYCLFDSLQALLTWNTKKKKIAVAISGTLTFAYAGFLFFGYNWLGFITTPALSPIPTILTPLLVIYPVAIVSRLADNSRPLSALGRNTMYLCGSEYMIKKCMESIVTLFGFNLVFANPLSVYFYCCLLLFICNRTFVPLEKKIFKKLFRL